MSEQKRERRWRKPRDRSKGYAEELKAKVHIYSKEKKGRPLSEIEKGVRIGHLQCSSDGAGLYKYTKALKDGKTKEQARAESKKIGK